MFGRTSEGVYMHLTGRREVKQDDPLDANSRTKCLEKLILEGRFSLKRLRLTLKQLQMQKRYPPLT